MLTIQIRLTCPDKGGEILTAELENAEFLIEELVSQALLELFEVVIVEKVNIDVSGGGGRQNTLSEAA